MYFEVCCVVLECGVVWFVECILYDWVWLVCDLFDDWIDGDVVEFYIMVFLFVWMIVDDLYVGLGEWQCVV